MFKTFEILKFGLGLDQSAMTQIKLRSNSSWLESSSSRVRMVIIRFDQIWVDLNPTWTVRLTGLYNLDYFSIQNF